MAENINNINDQDRLVKVSFIKGILQQIYKWSPLKKLNNGGIIQTDVNGNSTNKTSNPGEIALGHYNQSSRDTLLSVGIGESNIDRKNALEVKNNGMIYIITDVNTKSIASLQETLDSKGTIVCNTYEDMKSYIVNDKIGSLLYLTDKSIDGEKVYNPGLYVISVDAITLTPMISKLGTTSATEIDVTEEISKLQTGMNDLTDRVEDLEVWVDSPIENDELNNIINKIN